MHFIPSNPDSWFNLPREGGIAYAAQESWVQNETIKNNILFRTPYDEVRYKKGRFTLRYSVEILVLILVQSSNNVHWSATLSFLKLGTLQKSENVALHSGELACLADYQ